jgi:hypothetical protein
MNVPLSKGDVLVASHHHTLWCYCLLFASGNMTERGCRCLHTGLQKFGAEYYVLVYACCWELMKSVSSHQSLSLLFMMKVTVWCFVIGSHKVMTALIIVLNSKCFCEGPFLQSCRYGAIDADYTCMTLSLFTLFLTFSSHFFWKCNRTQDADVCIMVGLNSWTGYYILIYTLYWELMKLMHSYGSWALLSILLFI